MTEGKPPVCPSPSWPPGQDWESGCRSTPKHLKRISHRVSRAWPAPPSVPDWKLEGTLPWDRPCSPVGVRAGGGALVLRGRCGSGRDRGPSQEDGEGAFPPRPFSLVPSRPELLGGDPLGRGGCGCLERVCPGSAAPLGLGSRAPARHVHPAAQQPLSVRLRGNNCVSGGPLTHRPCGALGLVPPGVGCASPSEPLLLLQSEERQPRCQPTHRRCRRSWCKHLFHSSLVSARSGHLCDPHPQIPFFTH